MRAGEREAHKKLEVIEGYFKERSTSTQRNQADLGVRVDQLGTDIQVLQGKLEESNHRLSELAQRVDDQSYRLTEFLAKADALEQRMPGGEVGGLGSGLPSPRVEGDEKTVLPGRTITPRGLQPDKPSTRSPTDQSRERVGGLTPTEAYNLAYNDYVRGNYDLALIGFQNFMIQFPNSSLLPSAQYWLGESYFSRKEYGKAVDAFETLLQRYPQNEKAPTALLKEGYAYFELGDKSRARSSLKRVVEQFPFSNEAKLAKEKLADIR
jgi:tol-pal system protein YbgF